MSTELVQIGTSAVTTMPPPNYVDPTGFDEMVKVRAGNLKLVQPTTQDPKSARIGQFLESITNQPLDTVEVVLLKMNPTRVFFPPGADFSAGVEPLCRSNDGIKPEEGVKQKQSSWCSTCPRGRWVGRTPPDCGDNRNLLLVWTKNQFPYYYTVSGNSVKALQEGLAPVKMAMREAAQNGEQTTIHHYKISLGSVKATKGAYYNLHIKGFTRMPAQEAKNYSDMFEAYLAATQQQQFAEVENAVDDVAGAIIEAEVVVPEEV